MTCGPGEICIRLTGGIDARVDADPGAYLRCVAVPAACTSDPTCACISQFTTCFLSLCRDVGPRRLDCGDF